HEYRPAGSKLQIFLYGQYCRTVLRPGMAEPRELDGFITDPCAGRHILEYDFPLNCHSWCFSPQWLDIRSNIRSVSNSGRDGSPNPLNPKGRYLFYRDCLYWS